MRAGFCVDVKLKNGVQMAWLGHGCVTDTAIGQYLPIPCAILHTPTPLGETLMATVGERMLTCNSCSICTEHTISSEGGYGS